MKVSALSQIKTKLPKVIWKSAAFPLIVVDPLISVVYNHLTVFTRWRQCPHNSLGPPQLATWLSGPFFWNSWSLPMDRQTTNQQNGQKTWLVKIGYFAKCATWPNNLAAKYAIIVHTIFFIFLAVSKIWRISYKNASASEATKPTTRASPAIDCPQSL